MENGLQRVVVSHSLPTNTYLHLNLGKEAAS